MQMNLTLIGMLHRISQIVDDNLLHTLWVRTEREIIRQVSRHIHVHTVRTAKLDRADSLATCIINIALRKIEPILAALHIRYVQYVVDKRAEHIRIALDDNTILCYFLF